jgi:hypothetical protein
MDVCGGPEAARFAGAPLGPVLLTDGAVCFPSLYPLHRKAANMLKARSLDLLTQSSFPLRITMHLPVEAEDGFLSLTHLLQRIRDSLRDWRSLARSEDSAQRSSQLKDPSCH